MKKIPFILLISFKSFSQITIDRNLDLAFDYYRGAAVSWGVAEFLNTIIKKPFLSGFVGLAVGIGQGLILERGPAGKMVSGGGSGAGLICYVVNLDLKRKKREKLKIEF